MKDRGGHALDDELCDAVAPLEPDGLGRVGVQQGYLDLATVPGIHGARCIDDRHPVPGGQPGPRVHERRVPVRQRDRHPGGHHRARARGEIHVGRGDQVNPGVTGM